MKNIRTIVCLLFIFMGSSELLAQWGYGNPYYGNRFGRGRSSIPQAQTPEKEPDPLTAEQYVDVQMPKIVETLELDPFEEAVMRSTLVKFVQKRMELQILKMEPSKMKEEFEKLGKQQNEELKAGLPADKYEAYLGMLDNPNKAQRESKKSKRKRKSKKEGTQ